MNRERHPIQPLLIDAHGVVRFKANRIVRYLLDNGGLDLNKLALVAAEQGFTQDDEEQFAQLIGYSLSGFHELSYVSDQTAREASDAAKAQYGSWVRGCRDSTCVIHSGVARESSE